jgi:hypothetical protein
MSARPRPGARHLSRPRLLPAALPAISGLALALAAAPALAQVTAEDVWADWQASLMIGEGAMTVGSETYEGGVLTVSGLALDSEGEDGSRVTGTLDELVFTENGDGTVTITTSPDYVITISTPADPETESPATDLTFALRQQDLVTTASGEPGALTYDFEGPRVAFELVSVVQDGVEQPAEGVFAINGLSGSYTTGGAEGGDRTIDSVLEAQSMDLLIDVTDTETGDQVVLSGKVDGLAAQALLALPASAMESPDTALMDGLTMAGGYSYDRAAYIFEIADDETGPANGSISTGAGSLEFSASAEAVSYDSAIEAVAFQIAGAALPFPVSADLAEYGVTFAMPLSRSDAPAPWALGLNLTGLALNEEVWGLFDPAQMLPRDPATVRLDLTGTATLFVDLADPAQAAAVDVPGQVDSISIDALRLAFGGAEVTGSGAFDIDNTDLATYGGMPKPVGALEMELTGVNRLIDTLVSMGLLPQDQVMGARMMLGLLTTPVGDDQLQSRIELNEQGQIFANGQRLQ